MASRRKDFRDTLKGLTIAIDPATTDEMKKAAPMSSPMARLPEPTRMAAKVEKRSGDPFPRARKVTPAMDSDIRSVCERVARLGQKKSLDAIPIALNRKPSQATFDELWDMALLGVPRG
jgi:hypothetical protein